MRIHQGFARAHRTSPGGACGRHRLSGGRNHRGVVCPGGGLQRGGEFLPVREPLVARLGQRARHHGIDSGWQFRIESARRRGVLGHDLLDDGKVAVAVERPLAGEQLVQHDAGRKQVGARVDLLALDLLGRHVFERADHRALGARGVARVLDPRHAEVGQLDAPIGFYQQIGRLDVAVHDVLPVRVVQRRQQVAHDAQRLLQRVALALVQVVLEVVALDELHHQESAVAVAVGVVNTHDMRVLQARRRARLGAKTYFVFGRRFFRQVLHLDGLDRHAAVQVGVVPLVHQPHGAFAQHADQIVSTKFL